MVPGYLRLVFWRDFLADFLILTLLHPSSLKATVTPWTCLAEGCTMRETVALLDQVTHMHAPKHTLISCKSRSMFMFI